MKVSGLVVAALLLMAVALSSAVRAQTPPAPTARLVVTVTDSSGGVLPAAIVTVAGIERATASATPSPAVASPQGVATIPELLPGRYSIQAEFPGLETTLLRDVRLRAGENRQAIVLALPRLQDSVTVGLSPQVAAADRTRTFGSALTREQIDALSDDPDLMRQQLRDMTGLDAVIRVDSFEGAELPPKAQIKSIHVTRDAFAAENHFAGGLFIDIITQPGLGPIRGGFNVRLRDGSMSGKSPFTETKGPEQTQNYAANFGGSLIKDRSSFSLSISGTHSYDSPIVTAALPSGTVSQSIQRKVPRDNIFTSGLFDYALTKDQTLRVSYSQSRIRSRNLGVGAYDLPERAYSRNDDNVAIRAQQAGPLGRRFFINNRLNVGWGGSTSESLIEATTVIVTDAFTRGGQQVAGGHHSKTFNAGSDLDYVRGRHSVRAGLALDGGWYKADDRTNYLGTYTFESLEAFDLGQARSYTRRTGDPNIDYFHMTAGMYLQDDIRLRNNLTLSPGVRYEALTHVDDLWNLGPRFGITWAPFRSGRTTLRGSAGIFYDWMSSGTYEQVLRFDGFRQREINVANPVLDPGAIDPGLAGPAAPGNRYLFGDDLSLARSTRLSAGVDQTINPRVRVGVNYAYTRAGHVWRGENLNAPVDGVRPEPAFANIVRVVSDGKSAQHSVNTNFNVSFARPSGRGAAPPVAVAGDRAGAPPPPPPGAGAARPSTPRLDWRRISVNGNLTLGQSLTNAADGAFGLPATGSLENEWGPAFSDVRRRLGFGVNSTQLRNLNANINVNWASGSAYNIRTGLDDNGDLVFNDRPDGVGRNSARGDAQFTINGNFSYSIAFGRPTVSAPPGIQISGGPGGFTTVNVINPQAAARYRLQFIISILNLTNRSNYGSYSGVMTSPFFAQPTAVTNPRKVDIGMSWSF